MNENTVLWVYIVFLVVGGLMGFVKGRSVISLVVSAAFAAALALCALGKITYPHAADILLLALVLVFVVRFMKTKRLMPAGMLLIVTIATLAVRQGYSFLAH